MHKKLSFLALPLVLTLIAGCGRADVNVDKVNLKDALTEHEAKVVLAQVQANLVKFSKITEKETSYENVYGKEITSEISSTKVAYKDNVVYGTATQKDKWSDPSGLSKEETNKGSMLYEVMTEGESRYPVRFSATEDEVYFQVKPKLDADELPVIYEETIQAYVDNLDNAFSHYNDFFFVYKNGKSYKAIQATYSEDYSPVIYANDTVIHHTVQYSRLTWEINDKLQLTSFKEYYVEQNNIDQLTGEYLEKPVDVERYETECKFEYKDRAVKDKKVTEIEEKIKGNRFVNAKLEIRLVDENKAEVDNASVISYGIKMLALNKVQIDFAYYTSGMTDYRGITLEASCYFTDKLDKSAEKTKVVKNIPFSGEGITVDGDYGMYAETHDEINVVFSAVAEIVNNDVVVTPTTALQLL